MFKKKILILISFLTFLFIFITNVYAEEVPKLKNNKIETTYISIDTLTDNIDNFMLSNTETEELRKKNANKFLKEIDEISFNHVNRQVFIKYTIDTSEGDLSSLINVFLYNFFNSLNNFYFYDFEIEVNYKVVDSKQRTSKQKYCSYYFSSESLSNLNIKEVQLNEFCLYAEKS